MISLLPELITALYSAATASPALADVVVYDGPQVSETASPDILMIGFSDTEDEPSARAEDQGTPLPEFVRAESITITCLARTYTGATTFNAIPDARSRVFAIANAVADLVKGPAPLGDIRVAWCRVSSVSYTANSVSDGTIVDVEFELVFQAQAVIE